ncbi:hypothetical protein IW262DRAFT_1302335 [Armillaria fumosa]|nr:hypothetical protein IW262DRAFT_1302335 [Armillaria fumosa]
MSATHKLTKEPGTLLNQSTSGKRPCLPASIEASWLRTWYIPCKGNYRGGLETVAKTDIHVSIRGGDFIPEALEAPEKSSSSIDGSGTAMTTGLAMVYTATMVPLEGMLIVSAVEGACNDSKTIHQLLQQKTENRKSTHHGTKIDSHVDCTVLTPPRMTLGTRNETSKWMATVFLDSTTTVAVHTAAGPPEGIATTVLRVPVFLVADFYTTSVQRAATTSALYRAAFAMSAIAVLPAIAVVPSPCVMRCVDMGMTNGAIYEMRKTGRAGDGHRLRKGGRVVRIRRIHRDLGRAVGMDIRLFKKLWMMEIWNRTARNIPRYHLRTWIFMLAFRRETAVCIIFQTVDLYFGADQENLG